jgi:hypothetical protein
MISQELAQREPAASADDPAEAEAARQQARRKFLERFESTVKAL